MAPVVVEAWERQRTASHRKYGLNRYGDFFQTDMLEALGRYHGLPPTSFTPLAGHGEAGNVLGAALLRGGGELVHSWPMASPISDQARAWGGRIRRVPLDRRHRQPLSRLAAAVGPQTRLVHLQNPHDPTGRSLGRGQLEAFLQDVRGRNPATYVLVDESYAPYAVRPDFPDSIGLIARDSESSRLIVLRSLATAHGMAGVGTAYLVASRELTQETEGVTTGFFLPGAYGWANPDTNVNRMGEKALLAVLSPEGDRHLAEVRKLNAERREELRALLAGHRFGSLRTEGSFVFALAPGPFRDGGLARALARRGVLVRAPGGWGRRYRGRVRVSVGSPRDLERLDAALRRLVSSPRRRSLQLHGRHAEPTGTPAGGPAGRRVLLGGGAAAAAGALMLPSLRAPGGALERLPDTAQRGARMTLTRRDFARGAGLAVAGSAALMAAGRAPGRALAFPPDAEYDRFDLARMIYHENPVGPSPAAYEAVREVIGRGRRAAARYEEEDQRDLVEAILRYNRRLHPSAKRLSARNLMLLLGSAEGLTLLPDTFIPGGTLISEWPTYRIIRERVWQGDGTVVDVLLDPRTERPDYPAMKEALRAHPEAGLIYFTAQNNPMGTVLQRGEFDRFARWVFRNRPKTLIFVDDSDPEFMDPDQARLQPDFLGYVARGQNLVHMQTFSHIFALTGLRVGYLMAAPRIVRRLQRKRIRPPVNVFGHAAALASLADRRDQIRRSYRNCAEGREYIYSELDRLGLHYSRSQGQYVFFDTGRPSGTSVWSGLVSLGVLTRFGREWGRESWIRVNPGLPDENQRFIAALRTVLGESDPGNLPPPPIPVGDLLPSTPEGRVLARDLEQRVARASFLESRMGRFEGRIRVTEAARLRAGRG